LLGPKSERSDRTRPNFGTRAQRFAHATAAPRQQPARQQVRRTAAAAAAAAAAADDVIGAVSRDTDTPPSGVLATNSDSRGGADDA